MSIEFCTQAGKMGGPIKTGIQEYDNNPLIDACGPLRDRLQTAKNLIVIPTVPGNLQKIQNHVRLHQLMSVRDLHIPTESGIDLAMTLDLILRQSYIKRAPRDPATWFYLYQSRPFNAADSSPLLCASAVGISGSGKSVACERALSQYQQVVIHPKFPSLVSPMKQLVWLKVDVPASGRLIDLTEALMRVTDEALNEDYFSDYLKRASRRGFNGWQSWCHKASSNFIGILVLDEIQNFFQIESVKARKQAKSRGHVSELRVVEDGTLKAILNFVNSSRIGLIVMGTPDGMAAFCKRFSTGQRMVNAGHHTFSPMRHIDDIFFAKYFFPALVKYQWADEAIDNFDEIRSIFHDLSGGGQRIGISLWIHAHRCMWSRGGKRLEVRDFQIASDTYLSPLRPAIEALKSGDPKGLALYEDLLPRDDPLWMQMISAEVGLY